MGKSSSTAKQVVSEYQMSMHYGVCNGPATLMAIWAQDKIIWQGWQQTQTTLNIQKPNIFGGPKDGGGVNGYVQVLPGDADQILPNNLAQKLGRSSGANCPGFRGLLSLFFYASPGYTGFHWVSNSPYLPDVAVTVSRSPESYDPSTTIPNDPPKPVVLDWWQRSWTAHTDQARMGYDCLDSFDNLLQPTTWAPLLGVNPTPTSLTGPNDWVHRTLVGTAPSDTFKIRVYMEMSRLYGLDNDGYIDEIVLTVAGRDVGLENDSAERNNTTGWHILDGNLTVQWGDPFGIINQNPQAHDGNYYFSGGSVPYTRAYQDVLFPATGDTGQPFVVGPNANPAHIIYECLTDTQWGMGAAPTAINQDSFEACAQTLRDENLGLSMMWSQQTEIEKFVNEVLDHIQAVLFVNPRDGLFTLNLLRGDYDPATLPVLTVDNANLSNFQRKTWGEITNEIVVTFTNPLNEEDETVTVQDLGAIAAQGGNIISDNRNYYGVRNRITATMLANRDLRAAATPSASCDATVNRTFWDLLPGKCVKVTWAEHGLNETIMRIGPIDYGKLGDPDIKLSLVEDIFGLETANYVDPIGSGWVDPSAAPSPMSFSRIITLPSFLTVVMRSAVGLSSDVLEYPEVLAGVLASSVEGDTYSYDLYGPSTLPDGSTLSEVQATATVLGRATLTNELVQEATSGAVTFDGLIGKVTPDQAVFVLIGADDVAEGSMEIAMISAVGTTDFTLIRGLLDTTPKRWSAGTPVWFMTADSIVTDFDIKSDGESLTYKLLSRTSQGVLEPSAAPDLNGTLTGRPYYPLRPANVKVAGISFGMVNVHGSSTVTVSWANRSRLLEDSQVMRWDDATMTPEAGQTVTIELLNTDRTVLHTYSGLTGTSYAIPIADFSASTTIVRVTSHRDGFVSLQGHEITVFNAGYGQAYGMSYGAL